MVSTGMALVKYLLFTFNLIFATNYQHYNQFMDVTLFTAPILLMLIGVVVFVVASFGCTGAIMENYCIVMALHCCGVKSSNDWEEVFHNDTLPWSCCHKESNATINLSWDPQCTKGTVLLSDEKETGVYTVGCLEALMDLLTKNSVILGCLFRAIFGMEEYLIINLFNPSS
ncbi:hypothetical protein J437_LFUL016839 [Ladona fulva]|uniref:Tetraspanin n=1 Tax=Ladona fulva TaxID=123851 RepID=A0A8K0KNK7_LADFU|nr:hypothetical protein J437_LFUL016839 [Ladona fulva]